MLNFSHGRLNEALNQLAHQMDPEACSGLLNVLAEAHQTEPEWREMEISQEWIASQVMRLAARFAPEPGMARSKYIAALLTSSQDFWRDWSVADLGVALGTISERDALGVCTVIELMRYTMPDDFIAFERWLVSDRSEPPPGYEEGDYDDLPMESMGRPGGWA